MHHKKITLHLEILVFVIYIPLVSILGTYYDYTNKNDQRNIIKVRRKVDPKICQESG